MHRRVGVVAGLAACALLGVAPALAADDTASPGNRPPRDLHPVHTSGGEPGAIAAPLPSYLRGIVVRTAPASWRVAPGVRYTRWVQVDPRGPIVAHLLTVRYRKRGVKLDYAGPGPVRGVAPVRSILARDGAVAGVNGDFYDIGRTGAPLGLGQDRQRGLLHARRSGWNSAFYLDRSGRPHIGELPMIATIRHHPRIRVTNLNSPFVSPGGVGVYTAAWGRTAGYSVTQGQRRDVRVVRVRAGRVVATGSRLGAGAPIRGLLLIGRGAGARSLGTLTPGTRVQVDRHLAGRPRMAISGNQFLVRDGIIRVVDDAELHPRTAIGIDEDTDEVLLLVVDGRSTRSRGYTMVELADLMIDLGADSALNLDGGGSSTMVGRDRRGRTRVLNTPSDGRQRWVANAIEVTYRRP